MWIPRGKQRGFPTGGAGLISETDTRKVNTTGERSPWNPSLFVLRHEPIKIFLVNPPLAILADDREVAALGVGADRLAGNSDVLSSLLVVHVAWSNSRTRHLRYHGVGYQFSKLVHELLVEDLGSF